MGRACVIAALLCGANALAQERPPRPPPPPQQKEPQKPPLSREDAELVKELAVLERLDLLRNLDLFEKDEDSKQSKDERPQ